MHTRLAGLMYTACMWICALCVCVCSCCLVSEVSISTFTLYYQHLVKPLQGSTVPKGPWGIQAHI